MDDPSPKKQFSIRRLIVAVAVVSAFLALALSNPVLIAELVTVNLLLIAPAGAVFALATWLSKNRRRTMIVLAFGIFDGWLLSPQIFVHWSRPPTFWDRFRVDLETIGLYMLGGAVAATILDFIITSAKPKTPAEDAK